MHEPPSHRTTSDRHRADRRARGGAAPGVAEQWADALEALMDLRPAGAGASGGGGSPRS